MVTAMQGLLLYLYEQDTQFCRYCRCVKFKTFLSVVHRKSKFKRVNNFFFSRPCLGTYFIKRRRIRITKQGLVSETWNQPSRNKGAILRLMRDPATYLTPQQEVQGAEILLGTMRRFHLPPTLASDLLFSHDDRKSCCFFLSKASNRLITPRYRWSEIYRWIGVGRNWTGRLFAGGEQLRDVLLCCL